MIMNVFEELNKLYEEESAEPKSFKDIFEQKILNSSETNTWPGVDEDCNSGIDLLLDLIGNDLLESSISNQLTVDDFYKLFEMCKTIVEGSLVDENPLFMSVDFESIADDIDTFYLNKNLRIVKMRPILKELVKTPQEFLNKLRTNPKELATDLAYINIIVMFEANGGADLDFEIDDLYDIYEQIKSTGKYSDELLAAVKQGLDNRN